MKQVKERVVLATVAFLDEETLRPGKGGLQRWCWDVARLMVERGYRATVLQKSREKFETELSPDLRVIGVKAPRWFWGNVIFARAMNRIVNLDEPVMFVSQELYLGKHFERSIAVNHGIWWDSDLPRWKRTVNRLIQRHTLQSAKGVICVDTNYINWCHAEIPNRMSWRHKLRFVPNYADEAAFRSETPSVVQDTRGPTRILYPRRLQNPDMARDGRGSGLFLEALCELRKRSFQFEVEFAGPGVLRPAIQEFGVANGFGDSLRFGEYELEEMPDAYAAADIVVIPSTAHEGTSLAAVEAMVAGRPTVVTHIGGLPNLVIHGLNGFMCDLTAQSLADAIQMAAAHCGNEEWRDRASKVSRQAFGRDRWKKHVWRHVEECLGLD